MEFEMRTAAEGSLEATVQHVHPIGPVVRIELLHGRVIVEVELSRERHEALQLVVGQQVWFRPRQLRVFGADNQPAAASEKQAFLF
jgi:sulfate transport system ATP-binding protein